MNRIPDMACGASRLKIPLALGFCSWAASLQAHPGHSLGEGGPLHLVSSPYHLAALGLLGGLFWAAALLVRRPWPRRLILAAGTAALAALALLWPMHG